MNHYKGINETERYNNEMMDHMRKQTVLLEQIAQLLQHKEKPEGKKTNTRRDK
jgi:hypothetical protein